MQLLEFHRRSQGLTQEKAGRQVGASKAAWCKWEAGKLPSGKRLARVAAFCRMTTEELLTHIRPDARKYIN